VNLSTNIAQHLQQDIFYDEGHTSPLSSNQYTLLLKNMVYVDA